MKKRLVFHLGYHKTGSSSVQKWLLDHKEVLSEHLLCYNLADSSSNPLKFATHSYVLGQKDCTAIEQACRKMAAEIRNAPQTTVFYTDEGILGLPLGFSTGQYVETDIYPYAGEIVEILCREFAEFSPVFVAFEREHLPWLKSMHNQMLKQHCVSGDFAEFEKRFAPKPDWGRLRSAIAQGIGSDNRLIVCSFEKEFALPQVADMTIFKQLGIPESVLALCKPKLEVVNPSIPPELLPPIEPYPIVVLGGSNSMIQNGWVNRIRANHSNWFAPENLSIGAATTAMGLYRLLSADSLPPRAPVVWEYGVNEFNHFANGQSLESLLYHLHCLARICIEQERPLLPILMSTKRQMLVDGEDIYHRRALELFKGYGIDVINCRDLLHDLGARKNNLSEWYKDDAHYNLNTPFVPNLIQRLKLTLPSARVPDASGYPDPGFAQRKLVLARPNETAPDSFENSVLSIDIWPLTNSVSVPANGRVLAVIILACERGGLITIDTDGSPAPHFSTQVAHGAQIPRVQLRHIVPWHTTNNQRETERTATIIPLPNSPRPVVQNMFVWNGHSSLDREDALVGLLVEAKKSESADNQ